ncbi:MAG: SPOR domain-containing protein [Prevotella sp.]|nr:SPOR domain-containing protein [Prevotella sp.]
MISDKATKCPKCGCPTNMESAVSQNAGKNNPQISQQPVYHNKGKGGNINKWLYAIIALLLVVLAGGGYYFYNQNKQKEEGFQQKLIADSMARDSITKVEEAQLSSIEQTNEENSLQSEQQSSKPPTVYYVVIGSYSSLQNAIKARNDLMYISPEWLSPPPIFSDVAKGKVVYRLCSGIFNRKDKAKERESFVKGELGIDAWIWKSNGLATCVDRPLDDDDRPVDINPW